MIESKSTIQICGSKHSNDAGKHWIFNVNFKAEKSKSESGVKGIAAFSIFYALVRIEQVENADALGPDWDQSRPSLNQTCSGLHI